MDQVSTQLWLTDISNVMKKDVGHFDLVLTVCEDDIGDLVSCNYEHFDLESASSGLTRTSESPSYDEFSEAVDTLYQTLANDKTVLTHCHSGSSRSVAVAAASLARFEGVDFEDALESIKAARPSADPSELYRNYAKQYVSTHRPRPP